MPYGTNARGRGFPQVCWAEMGWEDLRWRDMLAAWTRIYDAKKEAGELTQTLVAARGKLSGQNVISKMRDNQKQGPQAETFIRAIIGLGVRPSEFFRALEGADDGAKNLADQRSSPPDARMPLSDSPAADKDSLHLPVGGRHGGDRSVSLGGRRLEVLLREISEAIGDRAVLLADARAEQQRDRARAKTRRTGTKKTKQR